MSNSEAVSARIDQIIAERLRVDEAEFDDTTRFEGTTLDAESLDMVEIAEAIEADVGVHISDDDLGNMDTVKHLKTYVEDSLHDE